jgi:hypothetical protein
VPEAPKTEPVKPVFEEIVPPKPKEIPLEIKTPEPVPVVKVPDPIPVVNIPEPEPVPVEVPIPVPVEIPKVEPIVEVVYKPKEVSTPVYAPDALNKLFELPKSEDLSDRFSHVPIPSIESAMGLNERIFTLNDLFGGDRGLFDATCMQLNNLNSFAEAKALLLNGPARHFNWADPERIKMAEEFIRIIVRRYPKS